MQTTICPLYQRRSADDNGSTIIYYLSFHIRNFFQKHSRHIVTLSIILFNSVKAFKYICNNVTKGRDVAVFGKPNIQYRR